MTGNLGAIHDILDEFSWELGNLGAWDLPISPILLYCTLRRYSQSNLL